MGERCLAFIFGLYIFGMVVGLRWEDLSTFVRL
jgi:hypothetical protein